MSILSALLCSMWLACEEPKIPKSPEILPQIHRNLLKKTEFAYTKIYGQKIICSHMEMSGCGLSLSNCTSATRFECVTDIEIVSLRELEKRVEAYKAQQEQNSL